ncbi:MAG TPA: hypothetical protein VK447_06030 [Myxococcaceae bacterium]|nr:hypothetical protein [Myxococcaceae bacterium]
MTNRHDTPEDLPAVAAGSPSLLARLRRMETLEALYQAWLELRVEHAATRARFATERQRLEQQGSFVVGAVRAAGTPPKPAEAGEGALVPQAGLDDFLHEAEQKLQATKRALEESAAREEARFGEALAEARGLIVAQVKRFLGQVRPKLRLLLRPAGASRFILHAERVRPDDAVLLLYVLTERIPSRYDFLFDDSTDDVTLAPPPLYPDEDVAPSEVRPGGQALERRLRAMAQVLPVKGFVPVWVPRPGGEDFFRLRERGPVMEAELLDGDDFRSVLAREEAERLAGHLLRIKLSGKLDLELGAG